jgi:NADP-dependent 3-hydroxy acid dehydrogenase YdfG
VTRELDRVVVITGASSGIGAATAKALVAVGARVVLGARRIKRLEDLAASLGREQTEVVEMDVRRPEDSRKLVQTAVDRFGQLDAFVANAGIGRYGSVLDYSDDECAEMIDVNFAGTVWGVRAAVPALLARGGGDLVILASVAGQRGASFEAVYAGTKFAQVGFAGAIDRELRPKNIRVSTICPASVGTEFAIGAGRTEGDPFLEQVLQAEDVAQAVVTVLSQPRHLRTTQWVIWPMVQET